MDLLALDDPIFVVDLTPRTMAECRAAFDAEIEGAPDEGNALATHVAHEPQLHAEPPIRALAFVFDWDQPPVLLAVSPTREVHLLDLLARLIRIALITERTVRTLVTQLGDEELQRCYLARCFPTFVYEGISGPARDRLPEALLRALEEE